MIFQGFCLVLLRVILFLWSNLHPFYIADTNKYISIFLTYTDTLNVYIYLTVWDFKSMKVSSTFAYPVTTILQYLNQLNLVEHAPCRKLTTAWKLVVLNSRHPYMGIVHTLTHKFFINSGRYTCQPTVCLTSSPQTGKRSFSQFRDTFCIFYLASRSCPI